MHCLSKKISLASYGSFGDKGLRGNSILSSSTHPYCSDGSKGSENVPPTNVQGMEVRKVTVLARHGDRSAIHSLPNSFDAFWSCHLSEEMTEVMKEAESHFQVKELTTNAVLERSFFPTTISSIEGSGDADLCIPGQLTDKGMKQHQSLGHHIYQAYEEFLKKNPLTPDSLLIRSTDYPRTIQSSVAFLTAFLPEWRSFDEKVNIWTYEDMNSELMHGQGIKHEASKSGSNEVAQGGCSKAITLAKQQRAHFDATRMEGGGKESSLLGELAEDFGPDIYDIKITDLTDAVHARICHDIALPCSNKGCLSQETAKEMIDTSHDMYCQRYSGEQGGEKATQLAMQPFLEKVVEEMKAVVDPESNTTKHPFSLYLGHDTVISPVLAVLGVYDCKWPPYASYISIELWAPSGDEGNGISRSTTPDPATYFRIFFNGQPVTALIDECSSYFDKTSNSFSSSSDDDEREYKVCPFEVIERKIQNIIKPYSTLREACLP
mmetsp:Transcript_17780/g.22889  ORF Transcript_17780/g.22889 Transcript_17780/m.22889 type:complete len:492 (+) Transcript_17780:251-1726(+)